MHAWNAISDASREEGSPARVSFENPDPVVLVDTAGNRAGVTRLHRTGRHEHRLLPEC